MPGAAYSARFIATNTTGAYVVYTVPAGKRAVLQSITCAVFGATATSFQCYVKTTYVLQTTVQGNSSASFVNLRTTLYAGEQLGVSTSTSQGHITCSGYLFDDLTGAKEPPTELVAKIQILPDLDVV